MVIADWIAADWGTSNLRVWAMDAAGRVAAEAQSADGMGGLAPDGFEPALLALAGGWLDPGRVTPVLICGMAGARQGWTEAAYRAVPCPPVGPSLTRAPARDPRLAVWIVPGLSQRAPSADVMRGEETQIAGLLAATPDWDGVACLPGTHSKWAEISAGEVVSFRSFMTGELYALLASGSVLRHALAGAGAGEGDDGAAFDAAVTEAAARPEALAARLFQIRAESLLSGLAPDAARARLSGALIGAELAAAKPWWLGRDIRIVGGGALGRRYARALGLMGASARLIDGADAALAGLRAARSLIPASGLDP